MYEAGQLNSRPFFSESLFGSRKQHDADQWLATTDAHAMGGIRWLNKGPLSINLQMIFSITYKRPSPVCKLK